MKITPMKDSAGQITSWTIEANHEEVTTIGTGLAIVEEYGLSQLFIDKRMTDVLYSVGNDLDELHKEYSEIFDNTLSHATAEAYKAGVN